MPGRACAAMRAAGAGRAHPPSGGTRLQKAASLSKGRGADGGFCGAATRFAGGWGAGPRSARLRGALPCRGEFGRAVFFPFPAGVFPAHCAAAPLARRPARAARPYFPAVGRPPRHVPDNAVRPRFLPAPAHFRVVHMRRILRACASRLRCTPAPPCAASAACGETGRGRPSALPWGLCGAFCRAAVWPFSKIKQLMGNAPPRCRAPAHGREQGARFGR